MHLLLCVGFLLLGLLFGTLPHHFEKNHVVQINTAEQIYLSGKIVSMVNEDVHGRKKMLSFTLSANEIQGRVQKQKVTGLVQVVLMNPQKELKTGDWLRIRGILQSPKTQTNPGQFNYAVYLSQSQIYKTIFVVGGQNVRLILKQDQRNFSDFIELFRLQIAKKIDLLLPDPENALASALLIGIRKKIPTEIRDMFVKTGTAQALAMQRTKKN